MILLCSLHECTFCTECLHEEEKKSIEESTQCQRNMLSFVLALSRYTIVDRLFFFLFFSSLSAKCLHATTNLNTFDKFFDLFCALFLFRLQVHSVRVCVCCTRVCAVLLLFIYLLFVRPNCVCYRKNHRLTIQFPLFVLTNKISSLDKCFATHAAITHTRTHIAQCALSYCRSARAR